MHGHERYEQRKYLIFLLITELAAMQQSNNLLHLPKTTRNTRKIANKLMIVASAEINLQSKHDLIRQPRSQGPLSSSLEKVPW